MQRTVEQVFREEWGRAVAILTRTLGDLERAEDAVQDAFAIALAGELERGLAEMDAIGSLDDYHLYHSARADLLRRLGRQEESAAAYRSALELTGNEAERRYLEGRLLEVTQEPQGERHRLGGSRGPLDALDLRRTLERDDRAAEA